MTCLRLRRFLCRIFGHRFVVINMGNERITECSRCHAFKREWL